jgi:hypothetical protein
MRVNPAKSSQVLETAREAVLQDLAKEGAGAQAAPPSLEEHSRGAPVFGSHHRNGKPHRESLDYGKGPQGSFPSEEDRRPAEKRRRHAPPVEAPVM